MSLTVTLCVFLLLSPFVTPSTANSVGGYALSAYKMLEDFNFPMGLLPKGATGYELDSSTGRFRVFFNAMYSFSLEGSYQLKYKPTIGGQISKNRIINLSGVSVEAFSSWHNIDEVNRRGDDLDFKVGIASESFPVDNFYVCGSGMERVPWASEESLD